MIKTYISPALNEKEILRYARSSENALPAEAINAINILPETTVGRVVFDIFEIENRGDILDLGFAKTTSKNLKKNLEGCNKIVLFAATAGIEFDRLIKKYERVSPSKALWYQSIGSAYVESVCDIFCEEITREYGKTKPRFSPGYGDLPIEMQRDIFSALGCEKNIGITLNDSFFMTPSKSVTAIIGICEQQKGKF
ncbi:MAG: Vitamin B12 dependent methionine synthase activation subunit [Oscillospiraceae bacterium]|nr:Vitamin B12 dependent methionine synthase activation subunit [Oscillospiraceae bacterium]